MAVGTAFKAFFKSLFNKELSEQIEQVLTSGSVPALEEKPASEPVAEPQPEPVAPKRPVRSEAVTLLATLQREARLIDFLQEKLDDYEDAQIGAAVRDVHRDSRKVLERLFDLTAVIEAEEGSPVTIPDTVDPGKLTLSGSVSNPAGKTGSLVHHGWQATRCDLPEWNGSDDTARVIAPAEVEL